VGDSNWTHQAIATDSAVYCATFNESRTLKEELAAKAQLRIAPGSYPLPDTEGEQPFGLPLYNPEHHYFVRAFAVLFDGPIAGACGLAVTGVEPSFGDQANVVAQAVDCSLDPLQTLTVSSVTVTP